MEPDSLTLAVGQSATLEVMGNYSTGAQFYMGGTLSSSNTAIATVSGNTVTAVGTDTADISSFQHVPIDTTVCPGEFNNNGDPMMCPDEEDMEADAPMTGTPDHLVVTSDVTSVLCTTNNTVRRIITYSEVDVNGTSVGTISTKEQFDSKSANSCNTSIRTSETCSPDAGGVLQDALTVGCNSVGGSCGVTYTKQKWLFCPSTGTPIVFAAPGDIVAHNDSITVGGSASFPAGTKIGKNGIIP
jgi:hypothetical protein